MLNQTNSLYTLTLPWKQQYVCELTHNWPLQTVRSYIPELKPTVAVYLV